MSEYSARTRLTKGKGRTRIALEAGALGDDLVVTIYNINAHIGAIALAEWDAVHKRASVSVLTRLGHKEDSVARSAAYQICKALHGPVCAIAGIHVDDITPAEIKKFGENAAAAVADLLKLLAEKQDNFLPGENRGQ